MAFYVRYFDAEALLPKEEDIIPFIASLNMLSPKEMNVLGSYMGKLKSGTNRIFLDKSKKKYILAIGTDKTDIADFQKNAKKEARPNNPRQVKPAIRENESVIDTAKLNEGWYLYSLDYQRFEEGIYLPYTFKAKIKDVSLEGAYKKMSQYLMQKHQDSLIPDFRPSLVTSEPVTE